MLIVSFSLTDLVVLVKIRRLLLLKTIGCSNYDPVSLYTIVLVRRVHLFLDIRC